ncbi:MAG: hypothetical protein EBR82_17195 [Caulobacteraceae bacterium]|nr:hypothetical protein [Caulobacteraceae bacterium]
MSTTFDAWLQQLAAAGKGGSALTATDLPPATRGLAWSLPIALQGNWSTASLAGAIRAAPDAASALATLSITGGTFDSASGYTTWTATLASGTGANSTGALPADTDGDGVEKFPISFLFTPSGGSQSLLFGGAFTLVGKV